MKTKSLEASQPIIEKQSELNFRRELLLIAFATESELINYIQKDCIEEEASRTQEILINLPSLKNRVAEIFESENNFPDSMEVKEIPVQYEHMIEKFRSDVAMQNTFSVRVDYGIVEIDKLIAAQRNVNIDVCEGLIEKWSSGLSFEELLNICLTPTKNGEEIRHLEISQDNHFFSSPNTDFRFLGSYYRKLTDEDIKFSGGGLPVAAIITYVGYGVNAVNVYKVGNRYILNNGFHRVYALRAMGITEIPVLIQNVNNIMTEFPPMFFGFPRDYFLDNPRPSLMKDFFEPGFTTPLRLKKRLRAVEIKVIGNMLEIPY